jgi:hypothetical protein
MSLSPVPPTRIGLATEQGSAAPGGGSNRTRPSTSSGKNRGSWRVTHVMCLPRGQVGDHLGGEAPATNEDDAVAGEGFGTAVIGGVQLASAEVRDWRQAARQSSSSATPQPSDAGVPSPGPLRSMTAQLSRTRSAICSASTVFARASLAPTTPGPHSDTSQRDNLRSAAGRSTGYDKYIGQQSLELTIRTSAIGQRPSCGFVSRVHPRNDHLFDKVDTFEWFAWLKSPSIDTLTLPLDPRSTFDRLAGR